MNRLMTPEHLHAVLNHLPLLGIASACIPLLYGLIVNAIVKPWRVMG